MKLHLSQAYETEIYVSDGAYVCIKQSSYPDPDVIVLLSLEQAKKLLDALPDLIIDQEELMKLTEEGEE